MNKEVIEKAADNYAAKANPSYTNGDFDKHAIADAFEHGAQWRINSVWHDAEKEMPKYGKHVVNEDWFDFVANDEKDMKRIMKHYPFKRWAYVSDLLPEGKEDDK